jgi:ribosomal protein S18 acetylase RimI-like enzyme
LAGAPPSTDRVCEISSRMSLPSRTDLGWRLATAADAPALVDLIRAAYRGPASYERWTTEEHLVRGTRTDERAVLAAIEPAGSAMLVVEDDGEPVACCRIADRGNGLAYFGMFAVDPARQGGGTGRRVLQWAELAAAELFGARTLELEVLGQQQQLCRWYERLGYRPTGETRPFPADPVFAVPMRDDLYLVVLPQRLSDRAGAGARSPDAGGSLGT